MKAFFRAADYADDGEPQRIVVEYVSDDYPDGVCFDWIERSMGDLAGPFASFDEANAAIVREIEMQEAGF